MTLMAEHFHAVADLSIARAAAEDEVAANVLADPRRGVADARHAGLAGWMLAGPAATYLLTACEVRRRLKRLTGVAAVDRRAVCLLAAWGMRKDGEWHRGHAVELASLATSMPWYDAGRTRAAVDRLADMAGRLAELATLARRFDAVLAGESVLRIAKSAA